MRTSTPLAHHNTPRRMRLLTTAASIAAALGLAAPALSPGPVAAQIAPPSVAPGGPASFAPIVERVAPAVVSIEVRRRAPARPNLSQLLPGLPFFLVPPPGQGGGQGPGQVQPAPESRISGSGFFISRSGYIVTNNHVVENATRITVTLNQGRELPARLIGRDPATDLAVLKVEGDEFPFVTFSTEARPRVGDWVIAVGNPFGLGGTATAGIVSADGRDVGEAYVDYLQVDAPINRGNSGGPTFDVHGRVIGVNTAIYSPSGGSVGIGFAIPAEIADRITRQLIAEGRIVRGYLGAMVQTLTPDMAESLGIPDRRGALLAEVTPGGPADQAGLRAGDAVLAMNGRAIVSSSDLTRRIGQAREGERLSLEVWRQGRSQRFEVRAGLRPTDEEDAPAPVAEAASLGLTLRPLDEAIRRQHRIPPAQGGVLIERVDPGSDAATKGLRAGDVIEEAGGERVTRPEDVRRAVADARQAGREAVLLRVVRAGRSLYVPLRLSPAD